MLRLLDCVHHSPTAFARCPALSGSRYSRYLSINLSLTLSLEFCGPKVTRSTMRFLLLSALAGMAVTSQPKLLVDRQDYTVHGGALVDCAPEYECGIYCRTSNYFCCKDGSREYLLMMSIFNVEKEARRHLEQLVQFAYDTGNLMLTYYPYLQILAEMVTTALVRMHAVTA